MGAPSVADFNGDGNPDILTFRCHRVLTRPLCSLAGNGDGTFTPSFSIFHFGNRFTPQRSFDVDGDGRAYLVELDGYSSAYNVLRSVPARTSDMYEDRSGNRSDGWSSNFSGSCGQFAYDDHALRQRSGDCDSADGCYSRWRNLTPGGRFSGQ